jgi:hypothetical protein
VDGEVVTDYTVTVIRDEDLWAVTIDGLPKNVGGVADYPYFSEIEEVLQYLVAEEEFRRPQDERDRSRARVLETLRKAGLTQRAVADVVDLSPQRVQQLLSGTDKSGHRGRGGRSRTPTA